MADDKKRSDNKPDEDGVNIKDFVTKNLRYIIVGVILIVLVVVLVNVLGGTKAQESDADGEVIKVEDDVEEEPGNDLQKDAYPQVNELVGTYYQAILEEDFDLLKSVVDTVNEQEEAIIRAERAHIEDYQNISCYTKQGLEETDYYVIVYYEIKFFDIETTAPGLTNLYVKTNEAGDLYIKNNANLDADETALITQLNGDEDIQALVADVDGRYQAAVQENEELANISETVALIAKEAASDLNGEPEEEEPAEEVVEELAEEEPVQEQAEEPQPEPEETQTVVKAPVAPGEKARIKESVRIRKSMSTESDQIGTAFVGDSCTLVMDYAEGWSKIEINGMTGFIQTQYLEK